MCRHLLPHVTKQNKPMHSCMQHLGWDIQRNALPRKCTAARRGTRNSTAVNRIKPDGGHLEWHWQELMILIPDMQVKAGTPCGRTLQLWHSRAVYQRQRAALLGLADQGVHSRHDLSIPLMHLLGLLCLDNGVRQPARFQCQHFHCTP